MMKLEHSDKLFMGKMSCLFALVLMAFITSKTTFNSAHKQPVNVVKQVENAESISTLVVKKTNAPLIR